MTTTQRLDLVELSELKKLLKLFGCVLTPAELVKRVGPMDRSVTRNDLMRLQRLAAKGGVLGEVEAALRSASSVSTPTPPPPPPPPPPKAPPAQSGITMKSLFIAPERQVELLRQWNNQRHWGFSSYEIHVAERRMPLVPSGRLIALVLVPYLDNTYNTLEELWEIAGAHHHKAYGWSGLKSANNVALRLGTNDGRRILRWETIDLGCDRGCAPASFSNTSLRPHAGVLTAAAYHPDWLRAMDGSQIPFVCLPGYVLRSPITGLWSGVPRLTYGLDNWRQSTLRFTYEEGRTSHKTVAVPQLLTAPN